MRGKKSKTKTHWKKWILPYYVAFALLVAAFAAVPATAKEEAVPPTVKQQPFYMHFS